MKALLLLAALSTAAAFTPIDLTFDPLEGSWNYSVDTPEGVYSGTMTFTKTDDGYTGQLVNGQETAEMSSLKVDGNKVSFNITTMGMYVTVKGEVDGDSFSGTVYVDDAVLGMTATRK